MNEKQVNIVVKLVDQATKELKKIKGNINKSSKSIRSEFSSMQQSVTDFNKKLATVGAVSATAVAGAVVAVGKMGSNFKRLGIATEVIADNMGYGAEQVNEWKQVLEESNTTGSNALNTIKRLMQSGLVPMVEGLERLDPATGEVDRGFNAFTMTVKDFAASMGMASGDAIDAVTSGLVKMNDESFRQLGVEMNLVEVYKDTARVLGKKATELNATEKRQAILNEFMEQGASVAGTYEAVYGTASKNLSSMKDAVKTLAETLGLSLQPAIEPVTNQILGILKAARDWATDNGPLLDQYVQGFISLMTTLGNKLTEVWYFYQEHKEIIDTVVVSIGIATVAIWAFFTAVSAVSAVIAAISSPIFIAIAVVAALVAAVIVAKKAWDSNWNGIRDKVNEIVDTIRSTLTSLWQWFKPYWEMITDIVTDAWHIISKVVEVVVGIIGVIIKKNFDRIARSIRIHSESIKTILSGAWNIIRGIVDVIINGMLGSIRVFLKVLRGDWDGAWQAVQDTVHNAWQNMKRIFDGWEDVLGGVFDIVKDNVKEAMNSAIYWVNQGINKINTLIDKAAEGSKAAAFLVGEKRIPNIPYLAKGTDFFKGGMAVVGEQGPELVTLPAGSRVHTNQDTQKMLSPDINMPTIQTASEPHLHLHIENFFGNDAEKDRLALDIWKRVNQIAKSRSQNPDELFQFI